SLEDTDTQQVLPGSDFNLIYDDTTNTAAFFYKGGVLPNGNYTAAITAAGVTDETGLPLDGNGDRVGGDDLHYSFFSLMGHVKRDGVVNGQDFNALANNYGAQNADWSKGDFNGDTVVDTTDFNVLAANFNDVVPQPQMTQALGAPSMTTPANLFANA